MSRYTKLSNEKRNGIVYTPKEMAMYLSKQMISFYKTKKLPKKIKILDPAIGDGELVIALISNLKEIGIHDITVVGFETEIQAIESTNNRISEMFPSIHIDIRNCDFVQYMLEEHGTFFSDDIEINNFDFIIANPPYIRTQILGAERSQRLSKKLGLTGRIDIYYAFLLLSTGLLNKNGIAGFITSNKFMTVKAGSQVRKFLMNNTSVKKVIDFGDTHIFTASVLPCIVIFGAKKESSEVPTFSAIYETKDLDKCTSSKNIYDILDSAGKYILPSGTAYEVKVGILPKMDDPTAVWALETNDTSSWLNNIKKKQWKTFADIGKVRVGIKTTADSVFIGNDWDKRGERPELLRPLITHRNAGQIIANDSEVWEVLYTHEVINGKKKAIDIEQYPISKAYLEKHRSRLESRKYLQDANRLWYEIWVPQDPSSWADRKIVFRDISEKPMFWIDQTGAIVNGDCYWIDIYPSTTDDEIMLALAVANSPFIEKFYDIKFNNKLYSGKRRYMAQYVEQFPIPNPNTHEAQEAIKLVRSIIKKTNKDSFESIKSRVDILVDEMFR